MPFSIFLQGSSFADVCPSSFSAHLYPLPFHGASQLAVVRKDGSPGAGQYPSSVVNVDTTHVQGLKRAKDLGLVESEIADLIVVRDLFEANEIFDPTHRGRVFSVFRHPVDCALSTYINLIYNQPGMANMTIEEFAVSDQVEYNPMVRYFSNRPEGDLTNEDLQHAMDNVHGRILVGLISKREETMERFEKFFGWKYRVDPVSQEQCRSDYIFDKPRPPPPNWPKVSRPQPGTPAYDMLLRSVKYDVHLYEFVESLFDAQSRLVADRPDGYRMEDATCCKCENNCP